MLSIAATSAGRRQQSGADLEVRGHDCSGHAAAPAG